MQLATAMDSYKDAAKQLSSYSHLSRRTEDFCENNSCLGKVWHDWGCCSTGSTTSTSASTTIASATTEPETDLDDPGWGLENVVDELLRMCEQDQKPNLHLRSQLQEDMPSQLQMMKSPNPDTSLYPRKQEMIVLTA